jgi:hypothetical protein
LRKSIIIKITNIPDLIYFKSTKIQLRDYSNSKQII